MLKCYKFIIPVNVKSYAEFRIFAHVFLACTPSKLLKIIILQKVIPVHCKSLWLHCEHSN